MNILRRKLPEYSDEEYLRIQTARLENSPYCEDKLSALLEIDKISQKNSFIVGINSLSQITTSISKMEDCTLQVQILGRIFSSAQKTEFVDIFLKDSKSLIILAENIHRTHTLVDILMRHSPQVVFDILYNSNLLYKIVSNACLFLKALKYFITCENARIFVTEGIFEEILDIIDENTYKDCSDVLCRLLKDQVSNQNYFLELNWKARILPLRCYDVYSAVLDRKNNNFVKLQSYFCHESRVDLQHTELISKLCENNESNFLVLQKMNLNLDIFLKKLSQTTNDVEIAKILQLISVTCTFHSFDLELINNEHDYFYYIAGMIVLVESQNDSYFQVTSIEFFQSAILTLLSIQSLSQKRLLSISLYLCFMFEKYKIDDITQQMIVEFARGNSSNNFQKAVCILLLSFYPDTLKNLYMNKNLLNFYLQHLLINFFGETQMHPECVKEFVFKNYHKFMEEEKTTNAIRTTILTDQVHESLVEKLPIHTQDKSIEKTHEKEGPMVDAVQNCEVKSPTFSSKIDRIKNWKKIFQNHPAMQNDRDNYTKKNSESEENIFDL